MLVTDLTDSEIVLGKLAARLLPVVALVAATVPVLAIAGLLGGIIIEAIATLTLITFALAALGCALALAHFGPGDESPRSLDGCVCDRCRLDSGPTRLVGSGIDRGAVRPT